MQYDRKSYNRLGTNVGSTSVPSVAAIDRGYEANTEEIHYEQQSENAYHLLYKESDDNGGPQFLTIDKCEEKQEVFLRIFLYCHRFFHYAVLKHV